MVVAAPLTSAAVRISADLAARKKATADAPADGGPDPPIPGFDPAPAPAAQ
jgi:hypothetical protein